MRTEPLQRKALAAKWKRDRRLSYRGVFLQGERNMWTDPTSTLRRTHSEMCAWEVPLCTLVNAKDWLIDPNSALATGRMPFEPGPTIAGEPVKTSNCAH